MACLQTSGNKDGVWRASYGENDQTCYGEVRAYVRWQYKKGWSWSLCGLATELLLPKPAVAVLLTSSDGLSPTPST